MHSGDDERPKTSDSHDETHSIVEQLHGLSLQDLATTEHNNEASNDNPRLNAREASSPEGFDSDDDDDDDDFYYDADDTCDNLENLCDSPSSSRQNSSNSPGTNMLSPTQISQQQLEQQLSQLDLVDPKDHQPSSDNGSIATREQPFITGDPGSASQVRPGATSSLKTKATSESSSQPSLKETSMENIDEYPSVKPATLNLLRRAIEAGDYEEVESMIWSNPKMLCSVCDSATYLMAGPKYNACHIAARANQPNIMALLLDTISNFSFIKRLYPDESDQNIQDRVNHLLDSYLNTPDPRQGNTPLHFACRLGHHGVVRVLLTFEGICLNLRDSLGRTPEETINSSDFRTKNMFKHKFNSPLHRVQLKNRLLLERRRSMADVERSFSDISEGFSLNITYEPPE